MYKIVVTGVSDFYLSKLFKCLFPESCENGTLLNTDITLNSLKVMSVSKKNFIMKLRHPMFIFSMTYCMEFLELSAHAASAQLLVTGICEAFAKHAWLIAFTLYL